MSNYKDLSDEAKSLIGEAKKLSENSLKVANKGFQSINTMLSNPLLLKAINENPEVKANIDEVKEQLRKIKNIKD